MKDFLRWLADMVGRATRGLDWALLLALAALAALLINRRLPG